MTTKTDSTITTTDSAWYANHSDDALRALHLRFTDTWVYIASNEGDDHPLAIEANAIAQAVITQLHNRKV